MPEIIDRRISFNAGEMSPWLDPRIDLEKYRMGCRQMENMRPSIYGGAIRRVGTEYIGAAASATSKTRLIPFIVNAGTNYILEFSNLKLRVWQAGDVPVLVKVDSVPMEVVTPFLEAELDAIQFAQQNDVMFLVHPNHPPVYLARYNDSVSAGNWTLFPISLSWPATLGPNSGIVTVQALATATSLFEPAAWLSGSNYAALVTVKHDSKYWRWLAASTSTAPKTPGAEGSEDYWMQVAWVRDTTVYKATEPTAYNAAVNYTVATTVKHGGFYYNWLQASLAASPKTPGAVGSEAYWLVGTWYANATAGTSPSTNQEPANWNSGLQYLTVGTKVKHGGKYWTLLLAGGIGIEPGVHEWSLRYWMRTNWAAGTPSDTLAVGQGWLVPLVASADLFDSGHVGARWMISHRRELLKQTMFPTTVAAGAVTSPLYVLGEWTVSIAASTDPGGVWGVNIVVERSFDLITWETHNSVASGVNYANQILTGSEAEPVFLRLKLASKTGTLPTTYVVEIEAGNPDATGMVEILSVTDARNATGLVKFQLADATATTRWEEPAWCLKNGFPRAVTLHEARLYFGGTTKKPTTVWGSAVDGYGDFRVAADSDRAVSYTLASDESSAVEWLVSQDQLVIGTTSGEWVLGQRPGDDVPKLRRNTSFGSAPIQARAISDALVFVQRSRRKLREFAWSFERDGYLANDLSMLAEHLGDARILQLAIQRNPEAVVWLVTERGDLLTLTYERGQNVAGWARQTTQGIFESVAVVNGSGEDDHIWCATKRTIDGATVRYIERFRPDMLRDLKDGDLRSLVFSDCSMVVEAAGSSTGNVKVLEGLTSGLPGVPLVVPELVYLEDENSRPSYKSENNAWTLTTETTKASGTLTQPAGGFVSFEAVTSGTGGNSITVEIAEEDANEGRLFRVDVTGNAITIVPGGKSAMDVSGTLLDINGEAVVFPTMFYLADVNGKPGYSTEPGLPVVYKLHFGGIWTLQKFVNGTPTAEWEGDTDSATPDLVTEWSPYGMASGTPVIVGSQGILDMTGIGSAVAATPAAAALVVVTDASVGSPLPIGPINLTGGSDAIVWWLRSGTLAWKAISEADFPWEIPTVAWTSANILGGGEVTIVAVQSALTGLDHLEGKSVAILTDRLPHRELVVSGGGLTLDVATGKSVIGLAYDSTLEPTFLETMDPGSVTKGGKKRLHRAVVDLWESSGVQISADGGTTFLSVADSTDVSASLITDPIEIYLEGGTDRQASVILRQTQPLPFNLMGLTLRYQVEM